MSRLLDSLSPGLARGQKVRTKQFNPFTEERSPRSHETGSQSVKALSLAMFLREDIAGLPPGSEHIAGW
jgi:hypothetical protein